ncbi:glycine-rich protein 2-like [Magallana gigas]|uniref:glycine-rich protein 2-like n=1 Tax=Magallana gigas TaxID=29159 RepID=UPI0033408BAD
MWRAIVLILNAASVACLLGSDFFSLSPFEQRAFEGIPGIPAEQLYKMADGSVSDAIKLKARLSLSGGAAPVPVVVSGGRSPGAPPSVPVNHGGSLSTVSGGSPGRIPSYYSLFRPSPSFGGLQLAYIHPGYPHTGLHHNLATMALID